MSKVNPFRPGRPASPALFAGRRPHIARVEAFLRQSRSGNPCHFLLLGERGLGKSSMLMYAHQLADGTISRDADNHRFMVLRTDINEKVTPVDLARKIASRLGRNLREFEMTRSLFADLWRFLERIEVMGTSIGKSEAAPIHDESTLEDFCYMLASTANRLTSKDPADPGACDGIVILIDEADRASARLALGAFVKDLSERLEAAGCESITVGLAGLPKLLDVLISSHQSAPRLFQHVELDRLSRGESAEAIDLAISMVRTKHEVDVDISESARTKILDLAQGHPHLIQQFGHSAFQADIDDFVDDEDVERGVLEPNGGLEIAGNIYYRPRFSGDGLGEPDRAVLRAVAASGSSWAARDDLLKQLSAVRSVVPECLDGLCAGGILMRETSGAARFKFVDATFGLWVRTFGGALPHTAISWPPDIAH